MNTNSKVRGIPLTANLGQACYECFKGKKQVSLQKCAGCLHVYYCGSVCQKKNWAQHKAICKALKALEAKHGAELISPYENSELSHSTFDDSELVNKTIEKVTQIEMKALAQELKREPTLVESNLIAWEPRCLACGRSDVVARLEGIKNNEPPLLPSSNPCSKCGLSFSCSKKHWDTVKSFHQEVPCQDGWNGFTQCAINRLCAEDYNMGHSMTAVAKSEAQIPWVPERLHPTWVSLRETNWHDLYFPDIRKDMKSLAPNLTDSLLEPILRGCSESLATSMTMLHAMEVFNPDDTWTKKQTLNIHILGAGELEVNPDIFAGVEEILHRLLGLKRLMLTYCGPGLENCPSGNYGMCLECEKRGKKLTCVYQKKTYHGFISSCGSNFVKPDLAIAQNSQCSREDVQSWKKTIDALINRNIPTVFTANSREDAIADAKVLEAAGATLHPDLRPQRNPWGSLVPRIQPSRITGFFAVNEWIAGGFN